MRHLALKRVQFAVCEVMVPLFQIVTAAAESLHQADHVQPVVRREQSLRQVSLAQREHHADMFCSLRLYCRHRCTVNPLGIRLRMVMEKLVLARPLTKVTFGLEVRGAVALGKGRSGSTFISVHSAPLEVGRPLVAPSPAISGLCHSRKSLVREPNK